MRFIKLNLDRIDPIVTINPLYISAMLPVGRYVNVYMVDGRVYEVMQDVDTILQLINPVNYNANN